MRAARYVHRAEQRAGGHPAAPQDLIHDFCPLCTGADGVRCHEVPECGFNALDLSWYMNSAFFAGQPGAIKLRETAVQASGTDPIFRYPNFRAAKGGVKKGEQAAWSYAFTMRAPEQR
jgi:hypothetical protein